MVGTKLAKSRAAAFESDSEPPSVACGVGERRGGSDAGLEGGLSYGFRRLTLN